MTYTRHSLQECYEIAKTLGGECLSIEYINTSTAMMWKCSAGHKWSVKLSSILDGHWCQKCHLSVFKYSIRDCRNLAASNGGKCLSDVYENSYTPIEWECSIGHTWTKSLRNTNRNEWCGECSRISKQSHYLADCHSYAALRGGRCLSDTFVDFKSDLSWSCAVGHIWTSKPSIIHSDHWCPECAILNTRHTLDDCIVFAKNRGGMCLGLEYVNNRSKLEWECEFGHRWNQCFRDIKRGKWCPECTYSKTQRLLAQICESILGVAVISPFKGFDWLKTGNKNGIQELDIWIPEYKLAIEYDGQQHYKPVRFGGISEKDATSKLEHQIKLDVRKNEQIALHPEDVRYFIRFNATETIDHALVAYKLKQIGVLNAY